MEKYVAAIDLGSTKIVAAVGEKTHRGVRIVAYAQVPSKGMSRGRVENPRQVSNAIKDALETIKEEYKLEVKRAVVGIAGHDIKCIATEPTQTQRETSSEITYDEVVKLTKGMEEMVLEDGERVICAVPQSYNVDNNMSVSQLEGMIGKTIISKFKLITGKQSYVNLINNALKLSNVEMERYIVEPIASANAILTEDEKEAGVAVVDIGGGTTDVIVIQNGIIRHVGIIPFGGDSITNDISIGCKISFKQAESIKQRFGVCFTDYAESNSILIKSFGGTQDVEISRKMLASIIQARMEEILEAAMWYVERSGYSKQLRAGYVFTGGGAKIKNLVNLANNITGREARIAAPNNFTITHDSVDEAKNLEASTAVGLIVSQIEDIEMAGGEYYFIEKSIVKENKKQEENLTEEIHEMATADEPKNERKREKKGLFGGFKLPSLFSEKEEGTEDLNAA